MKKITIYSDGACSGNPGPGGWAAILMYKNAKKEISGAVEHTTNNRMELMAVLKALHALKEPCEVEVYTDSAYVCNAFRQGWLAVWSRNGWKTSAKKDVENQDMWKDLLNCTKEHFVKFNKVKGHADNPLNNRCDELARNAIKSLTNNHLHKDNG